MTFSVLFWNIWYDNQINGAMRLELLVDELQRLVDEHQPDFVALCELVVPSAPPPSRVHRLLRKAGYAYSKNTETIELPGFYSTSVAFYSKRVINSWQTVTISKSGYAANRGHNNIPKDVLSVRIALSTGSDLNVVVAHPVAVADSLREHRIGMKNLEKLIRSDEYKENTVMVGDMNEWRIMPGSFRRSVSDILYSKTGSVLNPTWHHNAFRFTPLRLNLDYVYWSKAADFQLKDFNVLSSNISDHRPLLATFAT